MATLTRVVLVVASLLLLTSIEAKLSSIPESFDSRVQWPGCAKEILDQGECGSCWAFSSSEVLTDRFCIFGASEFNNTQLTLSPQPLISCDNTTSFACNGGIEFSAWHYLKDTGLPTCDGNCTTGCVPYASANCEEGHDQYRDGCSSCPKQCANGQNIPRLYQAGSIGKLPVLRAEHAIQQEILRNGPVQACFLLYNNFFSFFDQNPTGVYTERSGGFAGGHCVKIIGWGVEPASSSVQMRSDSSVPAGKPSAAGLPLRNPMLELNEVGQQQEQRRQIADERAATNGTKYWLISNSWGSDWGMGGLFKFLRGTELCAMELETWAGCPPSSSISPISLQSCELVATIDPPKLHDQKRKEFHNEEGEEEGDAIWDEVVKDAEVAALLKQGPIGGGQWFELALSRPMPSAPVIFPPIPNMAGRMAKEVEEEGDKKRDEEFQIMNQDEDLIAHFYRLGAGHLVFKKLPEQEGLPQSGEAPQVRVARRPMLLHRVYTRVVRGIQMKMQIEDLTTGRWYEVVVKRDLKWRMTVVDSKEIVPLLI